MKTEIYTDYVICLDNSNNIIEEYSNYAEMVRHLFELHSENPKADYFVRWYKYQKTSYTKEEIRKAGYCVEGEEESYDGQPVWGQYPRLEDSVTELDRGTYELEELSVC